VISLLLAATAQALPGRESLEMPAASWAKALIRRFGSIAGDTRLHRHRVERVDF
jgi:hypothetical protein